MAGRKGRERKSASPTELDIETKEVLERAAVNRAALSEKQLRDRARVRIKTDVPEEVRGIVKRMAAELDTSESQAFAFLAAFGAKEYLRGNRDLLEAIDNGLYHARALKFLYDLHIPDSWLEALADGANSGA